MIAFDKYEEAYAYAQNKADETRLSLGIEKPGPYEKQWIVKFIPRKENRYGYDAQCQAVEPS